MKRQRNDESIWNGVQHCRVRADVTSSNAWRVLGNSAKALYLDLRSKLKSDNNGNINAALSEMKHMGWSAPGTLSNALYQLQAVGLIVRTRSGGVERGSKVCSLYAFTDLSVNRFERQGIDARRPTFDYRNFRSIAEAQSALTEGVERLRTESKDRKSGRSRKKIDATKFEQVKPSIATKIEQERHFTCSKSAQVRIA